MAEATDTELRRAYELGWADCRDEFERILREQQPDVESLKRKFQALLNDCSFRKEGFAVPVNSCVDGKTLQVRLARLKCPKAVDKKLARLRAKGLL